MKIQKENNKMNYKDKQTQKELQAQYEGLQKHRSYKWTKYVVKVEHIFTDGNSKIKWFYLKAISANHAVDLFRDVYGKNLNWVEGEYMIILGIYDKPNTMYVGDWLGKKIDL
jgi:hypothetical protein